MPGSPEKKAGKTPGTVAKQYLPFWTFMVLVVVSAAAGWKPGIEMGLTFRKFLMEMLILLPLAFMLIGLFDVWVPKEVVQRHVGEGSGAKGIFWVVVLAVMQAGQLYVAFPVAYMLWKKGCSIRNIFIYLGAFSVMKFPMLAFEIGFLGLKFSLLRLAFTLPVFIAIGFLMEKLAGKDYQLRPLEEEAR